VTELPNAKSGEDEADAPAPTSAATPDGLGDTVVQISRIGAKEPVKPVMGRGRPTQTPRKGSKAAKLGLTPEPESAEPKPSIPKPVKRPSIADDLDAAFGKSGSSPSVRESKPAPSAPKPGSPIFAGSKPAAGTPKAPAPKPRPEVAKSNEKPATSSVRSPAVPVAPRTPVTSRESETVQMGAAQSATSRPTVSNPRRTRKARLRVARVDPWSVMKTVFLFSIAFGIMTWVATYLLWQILLASGVFTALNDAIVTIISSPNNTEGWRIEDYLSANKVLGVTALLAVINVIITTALGTLGSFLYNLSANILGGLELTLAED